MDNSINQEPIKKKKNNKSSKRYTYEFKRKILAELWLQVRTMEEIKAKYELSESAVGNWTKDERVNWEIIALSKQAFGENSEEAKKVLMLLAESNPRELISDETGIKLWNRITNMFEKERFKDPILEPQAYEEMTALEDIVAKQLATVSKPIVEPIVEPQVEAVIEKPPVEQQLTLIKPDVFRSDALNQEENLKTLVNIFKEEFENITGIPNVKLRIEVTSENFIQQMVLVTK